jgi:hypothetical protein
MRFVLLLFLTLSIFLIVPIFYTQVRQSINDDIFVQENRYPRGAQNYAYTHGLTGNVFNYYSWGGYMIWKFPQYKTFIDGRMTSWNERGVYILNEYIKVVRLQTDVNKKLDSYNVKWILFPTDSKLVESIRKPGSGWEAVYSDNIATVLVKKSS